MNLTPIQQSIIDTEQLHLLVSAGAGTGKTRVLVERYLKLLSQRQARASEILALTFTDKAASEMKARIMSRLMDLGLYSVRQELESAYIMTFHAFASRLLKEHPLEAAVDPDFAVVENEESDLLKAQALDKVFEEACAKDAQVFELLRIYGDEVIRGGILKALDAAASEGRNLKEYFSLERPLPARDIRKIAELLTDLEESELLEEWLNYAKAPQKDWQWIESVKSWMAPFARRGGKKDKPLWRELMEHLRVDLAQVAEVLHEPRKKIFESLALQFDDVYQSLKKEKGILDFHDLELKLMELLEKDRMANRKILERYQRQFRFIMVDEYQDTNAAQSRIVNLLGRNANLFFVGDYKQSIYGFRGTTPEYFLEKEKHYQSSPSARRVALNDNFRSQPQLLAFINAYFSKLWEGSGLPFEALSAQAQLKAEGALAASAVEIWNVEIEGESLAKGRMREANAIARKIRELHDSGVPFGDIVILFQAMTPSPIYEQALKREGVPFFAVSGRGYYQQLEIKDMINLLRCLDNPLLDIPLAAVLRSPLFQVSDDALVWLSHRAKSEDKMRPLYWGLLDYAAIERIAPEQKEKLREALELLLEFRNKKDRLRIAELLEQVMERTSYLTTVLADAQGVRRYANLKKLVDIAREKESREVVSLSDFVSAITHSAQEEIRESEAQIEAEKSGRVVRLMSVHKAKGLEFPVVFAADLSHANQGFGSRTFLAEPGAGYAFSAYNEESRDFEKTARLIAIDQAVRKREKEERKRLLYVAMTRAKSQLFLSGVTKRTKSEKKSLDEMNTWMEWTLELAEELADHARLIRIESESLTRPESSPAEKPLFRELLEHRNPRPLEEIIEDPKELREAFHGAQEVMSQLSEPEVKPSRVINLPVSAYAAFAKSPEAYWAVYEMGQKESQEPVIEYPDNIPGDEEWVLSAADFGTRMHRVLEGLDFRNPEESAARLISTLFQRAEKQEAVEAQKMVSDFMRSETFHSIAQARRVYRELPFILNERHGWVQGVIDLMYEDHRGAWHIVDYKTMAESKEKIERSGYREQMLIYAWAVWKLLKKMPERTVLYFLKSQSSYAETLGPDELESFAQRLRTLQEGMLDLRKERKKRF